MCVCVHVPVLVFKGCAIRIAYYHDRYSLKKNHEISPVLEIPILLKAWLIVNIPMYSQFLGTNSWPNMLGPYVFISLMLHISTTAKGLASLTPQAPTTRVMNVQELPEVLNGLGQGEGAKAK